MTKRYFTVLLFLFFAAFCVYAQTELMSEAQLQRFNSLKKEMPEMKIVWNNVAGSPATISKILSPGLAVSPEAVRDYFIEKFGIFYGITDRKSLLTGKLTILSGGFKKVMLQQLYQGIPVYGGVLNLNLNTKNQLISVSGKWIEVKEINIEPTFPRADLVRQVLSYLGEKLNQKIPPESAAKVEADRVRLVIIDPGIHNGEIAGSRLAYEVRISTETFYLDAHKGTVLLHLSGIQEALSRATYNATCNEALNTPPGTLIINESGPVGGAVPDAGTQNAHNFAGDTYNYFFTTHGRDGYDGAGATITSVVHPGIPTDPLTLIICCLLRLSCCGCDEMNAAWLGDPYNRMVYGDGGTSGGRTFAPLCNAQDIIAHELTHAVTNYSVTDPGTGNPVGLTYNGESGALNEAFSDIFAVMVDRADWFIAEDVIIAGYASGCMRNLMNPTNGGLYNPADAVNSAIAGNCPDHYSRRYTGTSDNGGVHINSTIIGHVAYLMAEGGTHAFSSVRVTGIGRDATERIFYRMLTAHMTPSATFSDARATALLSVDELFPGDSAKYATVWNAFCAAGINDPATPGTCVPYTPIEGRDPVNIVLTLDYSSSMNSPARPGGRPKIDVMKDAVEIFLRTWEIFAVPGDRADIIYFSSDVDPLSVSLIPFRANVDSLITEMRSHPTGTYTAMGGALQVALTGLPPGTSHPAIITFTNGIQNVNPMIIDTGSRLEIINDSGAWGGNSSVPENPGTSIASYGVPVHSIGIGITPGSSYHSLLSDITMVTGGELHLTNEPDIYLREFYLNNLVTALNLNTVEMVTHRNGTVNRGQVLNESVHLDSGITRAAFMMHWNENEAESLRPFTIIGPDNSEVLTVRWEEGNFYRIGIVDFPMDHKGKLINSGGTWRVATRQPVNVPAPYQFTVIVDEVDIHSRFRLPPRTLWSDNPLLLTAQFTDKEKRPLTTMDKVQAVILKPKNALGNILAKTPGEGGRLSSDLLSTPAEIKLNNIIKDPAIQEQLRVTKTVVTLNDRGAEGDEKAGDGIYSYLYTETGEAGSYEIAFNASGKTATGIAFERSKRLGKVLKLKPDPGKTEYSLTEETVSGERIFILRVTPADANDNLLGPGYESRIITHLSGGRVTRITDNLDGSYSCDLSLNTSPGSAFIEMNIFGIRLYAGFVSDFGKPVKRIGISLHAGGVMPIGTFASSYSPGILGEADIEYMITPLFSAEALFGYYFFFPDYSILSGLLVVKYRIELGNFFIYAQAGGGAYFPGLVIAAPVFGGTGGAGIEVQIASGLILDFNAKYHKLAVTDNNRDFISACIGMKYRF